MTFGSPVEVVQDFVSRRSVLASCPLPRPRPDAAGHRPAQGAGLLRSARGSIASSGLPCSRPWIFLVTDGMPQGEPWEVTREALDASRPPRPPARSCSLPSASRAPTEIPRPAVGAAAPVLTGLRLRRAVHLAVRQHRRAWPPRAAGAVDPPRGRTCRESCTRRENPGPRLQRLNIMDDRKRTCPTCNVVFDAPNPGGPSSAPSAAPICPAPGPRRHAPAPEMLLLGGRRVGAHLPGGRLVLTLLHLAHCRTNPPYGPGPNTPPPEEQATTVRFPFLPEPVPPAANLSLRLHPSPCRSSPAVPAISAKLTPRRSSLRPGGVDRAVGRGGVPEAAHAGGPSSLPR